jgi:hypothetical protein
MKPAMPTYAAPSHKSEQSDFGPFGLRLTIYERLRGKALRSSFRFGWGRAKALKEPGFDIASR